MHVSGIFSTDSLKWQVSICAVPLANRQIIGWPTKLWCWRGKNESLVSFFTTSVANCVHKYWERNTITWNIFYSDIIPASPEQQEWKETGFENTYFFILNHLSAKKFSAAFHPSTVLSSHNNVDNLVRSINTHPQSWINPLYILLIREIFCRSVSLPQRCSSCREGSHSI